MVDFDYDNTGCKWRFHKLNATDIRFLDIVTMNPPHTVIVKFAQIKLDRLIFIYVPVGGRASF